VSYHDIPMTYFEPALGRYGQGRAKDFDPQLVPRKAMTVRTAFIDEGSLWRYKTFPKLSSV
jgi:hypothetical protein